MHLAAYYIYENGFGIKNQTINFGGKYFYTLSEIENKKIKIERKLNQKYIPNFYDDTRKLTQVSAIVGRNGAGKTSLIKSVSNQLSRYFENNRNYFVFEDGEEITLVDYDKKTTYSSDLFENADRIKLGS